MLDLDTGKLLADRYSLRRRLGAGGEAETWLADDRVSGTPVALKIVAAEHGERLRAEWQRALPLVHAHIVRVFEFTAADELAFYSQQFVDGPDLASLAGRSPEDILPALGLIADALRYLHGRGLVHGDLKASNVLLDGRGVPYLTDFGVATRSGEVQQGGSLIARSPQSLDGEPAAPGDDVFALAALALELLDGRSPWSSADPAAAIRDVNPARVLEGSGLPPPVVALLGSMLARDAARRPDAADVQAALREAGFAPGPAPVSRSSRPLDTDEAVAAVRAPRRPLAPQAADASAAAASGISSGLVLAALGVLLAVLGIVVFVLPERVQREPVEAVVAAPDDAERSPQSEALPESAANERDEALYIDPAVRARLQLDDNLPSQKLEGDDDVTFSENAADYSGLDAEGRARLAAENALGELLSALDVLEGRGIERWAAVEHGKARDLYQEGDKAYLDKEFAAAEDYYLAALTVLEPTYERIEPTFAEAYAGARAAFDAGDRLEALRLFELAVAVTPTHAGAQAGLKRAQNLDEVLRLTDRGEDYERDLDLLAAQRSFERAVELDPLWQPAQDGLVRVAEAQTQLEFDQRMSEGFEAIAAGDYLGARAAFVVAQRLLPDSTEPKDGLLQVDSALRLGNIATLEQEALALERDEHWDAAITTYEEALEVDNTLAFAIDGLARAREMSDLHARLDDYIAEPDKLSAPAVMQEATGLLLRITARDSIGPRLDAQRDELSRLLKRAQTPLTVPLVSDNVTEVAVYRVGRLGTFMRTEINLKPGTYVAVGSRPGYRDVRLEFRVAPEIDIEPVYISCEEPI